MNDTSSQQDQVVDGTGESSPQPPSPQELLRDALWSACQTHLLGDKDSSVSIELGDLIAYTSAEKLLGLLTALKGGSFDFSMLLDVTAVDWMDSRDERFEVVYQLLSLSKNTRITVKVAISESKLEVNSATSLWRSANFLEREVWDMFGIKFTGHPDLRRILLYEEFKGHPLRKDYPVQAKQPRVPLRKPEVENTARQMKRPDLVSIGRRSAVN